MTVVLRSGDASLAVPMTALRGIRSWPGLLAPVPGRPRGALGYADTADGPVLVLDPSWCFGVPAREADGHLAVLLHGGRQLGLPCSGAAPGTGTDEAVMTLLSRLQDTVPGAGLLALAPCSATEAPATPAVRRALLLFRSGAATFLLPAEAVYAVVPPQRPRPLPGGDGLAGVCAHRGLVLPVQDAARRLGTGTMPTTPPMLHLGGPHPVALAVSDVLGLRRVPADSFTPVAEDSLVEALVALEGRLVPLCRPAALAAP
jgi:chemotaxis signal transduction protein